MRVLLAEFYSRGHGFEVPFFSCRLSARWQLLQGPTVLATSMGLLQHDNLLLHSWQKNLSVLKHLL